jgi:hypothetical protein
MTNEQQTEEPVAQAATPTPPDHLSVDPKSPFYDATVLERGIGIRFNGVEKTTVEEYCVSEAGYARPSARHATGAGIPCFSSSRALSCRTSSIARPHRKTESLATRGRRCADREALR